MAVEEEWGELSNYALGAYATPIPVQPSRTWGEAFADTGKDIAAGIVDVGRAGAGVYEQTQRAFDPTTTPTRTHAWMDKAADLSTALRADKSEGARYLDEHGGPSIWREPGTYGAHVLGGMVPYAPLIPLGAAAAIPAAALAGGMEAAEERESARSGSMDQNSQYLSLIEAGYSDQQARDKIYQDASDPTKGSTWLRRSGAVAGQALGWGAFGVATKQAMRSSSNAMTSRILRSVAGSSPLKQAGVGAGLGVATGYAQGAGTDLSRQLGQQQMGMQGEIDWSRVHSAGTEPAGIFGVLGGAGHGASRVRQLSAERAEVRRTEAAKLEALERAEAARAAAVPQIGIDTLSVARHEADLESAGDIPRSGWIDEPPLPAQGPRPGIPGRPGPTDIPEGGWIDEPTSEFLPRPERPWQGPAGQTRGERAPRTVPDVPERPWEGPVARTREEIATGGYGRPVIDEPSARPWEGPMARTRAEMAPRTVPELPLRPWEGPLGQTQEERLAPRPVDALPIEEPRPERPWEGPPGQTREERAPRAPRPYEPPVEPEPRPQRPWEGPPGQTREQRVPRTVPPEPPTRREATPREALPPEPYGERRDVTSQDITPDDITPRGIGPDDITPRDITPQDITPPGKGKQRVKAAVAKKAARAEPHDYPRERQGPPEPPHDYPREVHDQPPAPPPPARREPRGEGEIPEGGWVGPEKGEPVPKRHEPLPSGEIPEGGWVGKGKERVKAAAAKKAKPEPAPKEEEGETRTETQAEATEEQTADLQALIDNYVAEGRVTKVKARAIPGTGKRRAPALQKVMDTVTAKAVAAADTLTEKVKIVLGKDTSLMANLPELQQIQLAKLKETLAANPKMTVEEAAPIAVGLAWNDPRNALNRIATEADRRRQEATQTEAQRKAGRMIEPVKAREQAIKTAVSGKGTSMDALAEGANQTLAEQFMSVFDAGGRRERGLKALTSIREASRDDVQELLPPMLKNAEARITQALHDMHLLRTSGLKDVRQLPEGMPRRRAQNWQQNPWYDVLWNLNDIAKVLRKVNERDKAGNIRVTEKTLNLTKHFMADLFVLDLAIKADKIDMWDRYKKENVRNDYAALMDRRRGLQNFIANQIEAKDVIDKLQGRYNSGVEISDAERKAYVAAVKLYKPDKLAQRTAELRKHEQKIETVNEQAGIDLFTDQYKIALDFENRLIEMIEGGESARFIKDEIMDEADRAAIQQARADNRFNLGIDKPGDEYLYGEGTARRKQPVRPDEHATPTPAREGPHDYSADKPAKRDFEAERKAEEKATKRILEVIDETYLLDEAIHAPLAGREKALRTALGVKDGDLTSLMDQAESRMKALEDEQRQLAEKANPAMLGDHYGVGRILDGTTDLTKKGNLPAGAYVVSVGDLLGKRAFRPSRDTTAGRALNHVLDMAARLFPDMKVVGLTLEQMRMAAEDRMLPADTPSFYDPKAQRIFVAHYVGKPGGMEFNRALSHEIVHPLVEVALEHFPVIGQRIENIYRKFVQEVRKGDTKAALVMRGREHALMNKHEFLSEFFSDGGTVQAALDTIRIGPRQREAIAGGKGMFASALNRMVNALGDALRSLFVREKHSTLLSDAMVHSLDLFRALETKGEGGMRSSALTAEGKLVRPRGTEARPMAAGDWLDAASHTKTAEEVHMDDTRSWVTRSAARIAHNWSRMDGRSGAFLWGHDLSQQAHRFEPGMQAKTETVRTAMAHAYTGYRRHMEKAKVEDTAEQIGKAHDLNAESFKRFMLHLDKENHFEVSGSEPIGVGRNKWIHPTSLEHSQYRAAHAELAADYVHMPKPLRALRETLFDKYNKRHEEVAVATVDQLVEVAGMAPDPVTRNALVRYLRDKESITPGERAELEAKVPGFSYDIDRKRTDPEYKKFREQVKDIREAAHLAKRPGVWLPSFRRGDWVSEGYFNLAKHGEKFGGVELDKDNQGTRGAWEFPDEASRDAFVKAIADDPVLRKVKFRGLGEYVDEAGVHTYRATYNPLMLDFFQHQHEAFEHQTYLKKTFGDDMVINHVEPRKADSATYLNPVQADRALSAMVASLKRGEGWDNLDDVSRNKLIQGLNEGAVRHIMSASKRATYLPKNYALGARKDVMQDFLEYFTNTSYSLGELESRNEMKAAFKGLDKYVKDMKASNDFGQNAIGRKQLQASLHRRADWRPDPILTPTWRKGLARVMQLSYLDKLLSPMNWVLNYTELWMAGAPLGAGIHGARFYGELVKASHDIGLFRYLDGFKDAKDVYKAGVGGVPRLEDVPKHFKELTKDLPDAAEIHALIDRFEEYGHLDRDSSMEVGRIFDPTAGKAFRTVDWADNITRQISANIDNVNRLVYGIALMRASKSGKGNIATLAGRLAHAEHYTGKMAGNYSKYNEAEMFRHPALGPAMQFKRYAQRTTANWIGVAYHSFAKDVPAEQKSAARMQLMYMMGTMIAVSGVLGLPTEPIKGAINAFSPISGFNSDDAEDLVRRGMAAGFGQNLGYALSRGIPRAWLNMGVGTRLGLDSLWTQGAPDTRRPEGIYAAAGHLAVGAPGAYLIEGLTGLGRMGRGIGHMISGNTTEGWNELRQGATLALPFKAGVDNLNAAVNYFGGPQTRTRFGYPLGYQPSVAETAMQMIGLQSGHAQERGDLRRRESKDMAVRQEMTAQAFAMYVNASTRGEQTSIRKQAMEQYNARWPEEPLTVADFLRADQRHKKKLQDMAGHPERAGLTMNRNQQKFVPRYADTYVVN